MGVRNPLESQSFVVPQTTALGPATDGASAALDISGITSPTGPDVLVIVVGTGTIKVQVSNDGSNWFDVGADITATTKRSLATDFIYVRVKCTANAAGGAISATVVGRPVFRAS